MSEKQITKEDIVNDFLKTNQKFQERYPKKIVSRNYYVKHNECGWAFQNYFEKFTELRSVALGETEQTIEYEKRIYLLEEEIKKLKSIKINLLRKYTLEDKILELYDENLKLLDFDNIKMNQELSDVKTQKESILVLSDLHAGEVVIKEEVNGVNEYNIEIMKKRLDLIFNDFIFHNKEFGINKIHILFNGDLLGGAIHRELERTNEMNEVEVLFVLQQYISEKLLFLSEHFNEINTLFIIGNHSRVLSGRPYFKEKVKMNYEYILAKQLQIQFKLLQNESEVKKIKITVPESPFYVLEVNGRKFLVTHGDIMSGGGSGGFASIPYYSLAMSSAKFYGVLSQIGVQKNKHVFDDIIIGHLHTTANVSMFNGGNLYINGCVIGTNEFSLFKMKSIAKIEQTMLVVNSHSKVHANITVRGKYDE